MGLPRHLLRLFRAAPSKRTLLRSLALGSKGGDRTITSVDGTELSVRCSGQGPPLVLVHGTVDSMGAFSLVELLLAERYRVWVYDRRGRGGSGDGPPGEAYSLDREVDDLRAVLAAAGDNPHVLGHSFGGVVALRAAVEGVTMRSLILYEPPLAADRLDRDALAEISAAVDRGDREHALRTMTERLAGVTDEELGVVRSIPPMWKELLETVETAPREVTEIADATWDQDRLPLTGTPTLFIRGSRDSSPVYPTVEEMSEWVAGPEVVTIDGQGHLATSFAPNQFADEVLAFLDRH